MGLLTKSSPYSEKNDFFSRLIPDIKHAMPIISPMIENIRFIAGGKNSEILILNSLNIYVSKPGKLLYFSRLLCYSVNQEALKTPVSK